MNRELLYRYVETRLSEEGFAPEQIGLQTQKLKEKYAAMSDGEVTADVRRYGGPDKLADSVIAGMRIPHPVHPSAVSEEPEVRTQKPITSQIPRVSADSTRMIPKVTEPEAAGSQTIGFSPAQVKKTEEKEEEVFAVTAEEIAEIEQTAESDPVPVMSKGTKPRTFLYPKINWDEGTPEARSRFKLIFWLTCPLWGAVLLLAAALLLAAFAAVILLVPVLILALVAAVAAGAVAALVGIIFGISKLFTVAPIGLDNIGLGIMAIGITMFVGILLYNGALRLCPYLFRKLKAFFGYCLRFCSDLYYYVRGEAVNR